MSDLLSKGYSKSYTLEIEFAVVRGGVIYEPGINGIRSIKKGFIM